MRYARGIFPGAPHARTVVRCVSAVALAIALAGCAAKKPPAPPPRPPFGAHTATLDIIYGIDVLGVARMPPGFVPNSDYAPLWLKHGTEVGIVGTAGGETTMIGFSGPRLSNHRIIAAESDLGGHILDVSAKADGAELAIALARPAQNRLEVFARAISGGDRSLATVDGNFDSAELAWLDPGTLALVLLPPLAQEQLVTPGSIALSSGGLYLIRSNERVTQRLDLPRCDLSPLSFSPDGSLAIGQGDAFAAPVIIDLHRQSCRSLGLRVPLKLLAWARDSAGFLYVARSGDGSATSVFRYDVASAQSVRIAISSAAAAYARDGTIVTLGSRDLSAQRITAEPGRTVKAEIALMKPREPEITVNSLGFETLPEMLAASTMVFSTASDDGVIDTAISGAAGPLRELIEYSYATHAAFVLASGRAQGPVSMSWSPDGKMLAFVDGDARSITLTVIAPPR